MLDFRYHTPDSLSAASALLRDAEDARLIAGGMTLLPTMKQRLAAPSDLVDLRMIPGLADIVREADGVRIGAMARHVAVERSEIVFEVAPALTQLAGVMQGRTVIVMLERGRIVERGTHEELVEAGGYYAALSQKQMLEEELEAI